jgi:hypothetical protein
MIERGVDACDDMMLVLHPFPSAMAPCLSDQTRLTHLLVDLGQNLGILEQVVLLISSASLLTHSHSSTGVLTSSPTLIGLPPHPGSKTLSPTFTETA